MSGTRWVVVLALALLAPPGRAQEASPVDAWSEVVGRTWWDVSAFAGATYAFHEGPEGQRLARRTIFGSGVPVISETDEPVEVRGDLVEVSGRRFRFEPRAGVLRGLEDVGARLVPWSRELGPTAVPLLPGAERIPFADLLDLARRHPDAVMRREAIAAVAFARRHQAGLGFPDVGELLRDPDDDVRAFAAWAAGQCRELSAISALSAALCDPSPLVRAEAGVALARGGGLGGPGAAALVAAHVAHEPDPATRERLERAIERR